MNGKLSPANLPPEWRDHYRDADRRRRQAGWHRRSETPSAKGWKLETHRVFAIVLGAAAVAVVLSVVIPT